MTCELLKSSFFRHLWETNRLFKSQVPYAVLLSGMRYLLVCLSLLIGCSDREPANPSGDASFSDVLAMPDATDVPDATDATMDAEDAACASVFVEANLDRGPVDIVWMVDNSPSMEPAIEEVRRGLNDFAALIAAGGLDYRVIMLSERGTGQYDVCIPPPLSGDSSCGDGERFRHSNVDIRSTQPLEQFLGTLAQTSGYSFGDSRGGEPWRDFLRADSTKNIVIVTDDNSRFSADQFEGFPGGSNPFNSTELPPGILDASWGGLFDGYVFHGLYGYGESGADSEPCRYRDGSRPASGGSVYSSLIMRSGGVRASLCDGASAWGPFFESLATNVAMTAQVDCEIALPEPPDGMTLDPRRVNVVIRTAAEQVTIPKVPDEAGCGLLGGWYYDNDAEPTRVILCPRTCDLAQEAGAMEGGGVSVQFGCETLII